MRLPSTAQATGDSMYADSGYYRMLFDGRQHDISFYRRLAATYAGSVLEYGVGTGRVALALAKEGHVITGVDRSAQMLAALAEQVAELPPEVAGRLSWQCADSRSLALDKRFELAICPFNGIAHMHDEDDFGRFFTNVRQHLVDDGVFAFDVLIPDPGLLRGEGSSVPWFRHPSSGEVSRCDENITYDPLSQILTITTTVRSMQSDAAPQVLTLCLRQLFPAETMLLLRHHGLKVVSRHTDLGDVIGYVCRFS